MIFRPFKREDVDKVWLVFSEFNPGQVAQYLDVLDRPNQAYTFEKSGEVLAIGGLTILFPGVSEAWLGANTEAWNYPKAMFKGCKEAFAVMAKIHGIHRIQAMVDPENDAAARFANHLGFEYEGVMRQYSVDRKDMARYSLIIK